MAASVISGVQVNATEMPAPPLQRLSTFGETPSVLADIYHPENHLTVWQRALDLPYRDSASRLLELKPNVEVTLTMTPDNTAQRLIEALGVPHVEPLCQDMAEVVDMFCCLFNLRSAGLRLAALSRAMCPRFHVDRVPCRLVTTYSGAATEWLPHDEVDRSKLGRAGDGLTDLQAGLYTHEQDVSQLQAGDVALLKGELWEGNLGAGLVHRSPGVPEGTARLVLTLDIGEQI
ncbi:MAG: DUF1826 domain-containing protein [Pseudomonadota bacterium]